MRATRVRATKLPLLFISPYLSVLVYDSPRVTFFNLSSTSSTLSTRLLASASNPSAAITAFLTTLRSTTPPNSRVKSSSSPRSTRSQSAQNRRWVFAHRPTAHRRDPTAPSNPSPVAVGAETSSSGTQAVHDADAERKVVDQAVIHAFKARCWSVGTAAVSSWSRRATMGLRSVVGEMRASSSSWESWFIKSGE